MELIKNQNTKFIIPKKQNVPIKHPEKKPEQKKQKTEKMYTESEVRVLLRAAQQLGGTENGK